ncbi:hypothetical protein [Streptomyces chrestomyceticus]|uniref:Secreted protein n=1 Tax=Streptomyces chrestomyceticus TaxID=68185 RepID=A0ABU7X5S9_9ACTN
MLGIVGGVVAFVVVGGTVAGVMMSGAGGTKYKTVVPKTLVDGKYTLTKDLSDTVGAQVPRNGSYAHNMTTVGGQYQSGAKSLVLLSMYGSVSDPTEAVKQTIHGMESSGGELVVPKHEERPHGAGVLRCPREAADGAEIHRTVLHLGGFEYDRECDGDGRGPDRRRPVLGGSGSARGEDGPDS